jgi:hypothetical protein
MANLPLQHKPKHGGLFRSANQKNIDAKIQACLAMKDNAGAMSCLKDTIEEAQTMPKVCPPKLVLFTQPECDFCDNERKHLQDDIDKGLVEEISVDTPEGEVIAKRNEIEVTPSVVLMNCRNKVIE